MSKHLFQLLIVLSVCGSVYFLYSLIVQSGEVSHRQQQQTLLARQQLLVLDFIRIRQERDSVLEVSRILRAQVDLINQYSDRRDTIDSKRFQQAVSSFERATVRASTDAIKRQKMQVEMIMPDSSRIIARVRDSTLIEVDRLKRRLIAIKTLEWTDGYLQWRAVLKGDSLLDVQYHYGGSLRKSSEYISRGAWKRPDLQISITPSTPHFSLDSASRYMLIHPYTSVMESLLKKPKKNVP